MPGPQFRVRKIAAPKVTPAPFTVSKPQNIGGTPEQIAGWSKLTPGQLGEAVRSAEFASSLPTARQGTAAPVKISGSKFDRAVAAQKAAAAEKHALAEASGNQMIRDNPDIAAARETGLGYRGATVLGAITKGLVPPLPDSGQNLAWDASLFMAPIRMARGAVAGARAFTELKGAGEAAVAARQAYHASGITSKAIAKIKTRTFKGPNGFEQQIPAPDSRFGRVAVNLLDSFRGPLGHTPLMKSESERSAHELGVSLTNYNKVIQGPANALLSVGKHLNAVREYALRLVAEQRTPEESIAHHVGQAQAPGMLEEYKVYHAIHASTIEKASKYVTTDVEGHVVFAPNAPKALTDAYDVMKMVAGSREDLLKSLGRLTDEQAALRAVAPKQIVNGARYKTFKEQWHDVIENSPARTEMIHVLSQIKDPHEASSIVHIMDAQAFAFATKHDTTPDDFYNLIHSVRFGDQDLQPGEFTDMLNQMKPEEQADYWKTVRQLHMEGIPESTPEVQAINEVLPSDISMTTKRARVLAKDVISQGKMPKGLNEEKHVAQVIQRFFNMAQRGAANKDWYERGAQNIAQLAAWHNVDPETIARLAAVYSQRKSPSSSVPLILRALQDWKEHGEVRSGMKEQKTKAEEILRGGKPFTGQKTSSFSHNLIASYQKSPDDKATIDSWMKRVAMPGTLDNVTTLQYDAISRINAAVARELGWSPKEVQASVWVVAKAEGLMRDNPGWSPEKAIREAGDAFDAGIARHGAQTRLDLGAISQIPKDIEPTTPDELSVLQHHLTQQKGTNLKGLPGPIKVDGFDRSIQFHSNGGLQKISEAFQTMPKRTLYVRANPERGKRIADWYAAAQHSPDDPEVRHAYGVFARETLEQYHALVKDGYTFEFYPGHERNEYGDPYPNGPREAMLDLNKNKHLYVFPTNAGFGTVSTETAHPLLGDSGIRWNDQSVMHNDLFRAVHDVFGHNKEGVGFRADGEENAYQSHRTMYSPEAQKAMASETRGQNSWVNFGPHGEKNVSADQAHTTYADQKAILAPDWVINEGGEQLLHESNPTAAWAQLVEGFSVKGARGKTTQLSREQAEKELLSWIERNKGNPDADTLSSLYERSVTHGNAPDPDTLFQLSHPDPDWLRTMPHDALMNSIKFALDKAGSWREVEPYLNEVTRRAYELIGEEDPLAAAHLFEDLAKEDPDLGDLFDAYRALSTKLMDTGYGSRNLGEITSRKPQEPIQWPTGDEEKSPFYLDMLNRMRGNEFGWQAEELFMSKEDKAILDDIRNSVPSDFFQRGGSLEGAGLYGIKGQVKFSEKGAEITIGESGDVTTMAHEVAHVARRVLTDKQQKIFGRWAGATPIKERIDGRLTTTGYTWTREAEEKFARGWESFLRTGQAPEGVLGNEITSISKKFREIYDVVDLPDLSPRIAKAYKSLLKFAYPKGGRIVGADDIMPFSENMTAIYAPSQRGIPLAQGEQAKAVGAYVRSGYFGGSRSGAIGAGPDDEALKHSFTGALMLSGFSKITTSQPSAMSLIKAVRLNSARFLREEMLKASSELPTPGIDPIAIKIDPSKNLPKGFKSFMDKLVSGEIDDKDLTELSSSHSELLRESLLPRMVEGKTLEQAAAEALANQRPFDNIRWIDGDWLEQTGILHVMGASKEAERAMNATARKWGEAGVVSIDTFNDIQKALILYLNPAYIPVNLAGNLVMNFMHQGVYAPHNLWRATLIHRELGEGAIGAVNRTTIDDEMGTGITTSLLSSNPGALIHGTMGYWVNKVVDLVPRRAAWLHEARKAGYHNGVKIQELLAAGRANDKEALRTIDLITRKAKDAIVDYDRMTPWERKFIARVIFFYPWLRGATRYSAQFIANHPLQAFALAMMYDHALGASHEKFGDRPSYAASRIPLSTDSLGLSIPGVGGVGISDAVGSHTWTQDDLPMSVDLRQALTFLTPTELIQAGVSFATGKNSLGGSAADVGQMLTPFFYNAGVAIYGYDPYKHREVRPGMKTFVDQSTQATILAKDFRTINMTDAERKARNERSVYPRNRTEDIVKMFASGFTPTPYNKEIGELQAAQDEGSTQQTQTLTLIKKSKDAGVGEPPQNVLDDVKWKHKLLSGLPRGAQPTDRALHAAEVYAERYGRPEVVETAKQLQAVGDNYDAAVLYHQLSEAIYPNLKAWNSQLATLKRQSQGR